LPCVIGENIVLNLKSFIYLGRGNAEKLRGQRVSCLL